MRKEGNVVGVEKVFGCENSTIGRKDGKENESGGFSGKHAISGATGDAIAGCGRRGGTESQGSALPRKNFAGRGLLLRGAGCRIGPWEPGREHPRRGSAAHTAAFFRPMSPEQAAKGSAHLLFGCAARPVGKPRYGGKSKRPRAAHRAADAPVLSPFCPFSRRTNPARRHLSIQGGFSCLCCTAFGAGFPGGRPKKRAAARRLSLI